MSKFPKSAMNLKQFIVRQEVLSLYRDIHRAIRQVPDEKTRLELREWARTDFRKNQHETDVYCIKSKLLHGKKSLQELQTNLGLSSSQIAK